MTCQECNLGLGHFDDVPDRLRAAAAYLETPPCAHLNWEIVEADAEEDGDDDDG